MTNDVALPHDPEVAEARRLRTLDSYRILDTPPENAFDRLVQLASGMFSAPIASVSLIDRDRQWFKASVGLDVSETPRSDTFSTNLLDSKEILVVSDSRLDDRFRDNPMVAGTPYIRFYFGVPLVAPEGDVLGAIWIGDVAPRGELTTDEIGQFRSLADLTMSELELRREVDRRRLAEEQSAQARTDLETTLSLSGVASWSLDLKTDRVQWSGAYKQVWGDDAATALTTGDAALARIHPDDLEGVQAAMAAAEDPEVRYDALFRLRMPNDEIRWLSGTGDVRDTEEGQVLTGINIDVTDTILRQKQDALHNRELHHRLRNLFATIQSIMSLTRQSATGIDDYIDRITGRLRALNRAQQILLDTNFVTGSLDALVSDLAQTHGGIDWDGPPLSLPENAMVSVSLVLNELATNATKYGALRDPDGRVTVSWDERRDADGKGSVTLVWTEHDPDAAGVEPGERGFGSSLIDHSIQGNLNGTVAREWGREGLIVTVAFPRPQPAAATPPG